MPRSAYQFQTIRSEGAILPPDLLQKIVGGEVEGLAPDAYHLSPGIKLKEAISQSWTRMLAHWRDFRKVCSTLGEHDETGTVPTREKWLLPLLNEFGYGRLPTAKAPEIDGKTYPIDRFYNHVPIHLIGFKLPLDRRTKGARGAATSSPHSMLQEFLNRSEPNLWGILSNGLQFRILRDSKALSRLSYLEFDLESMFEGETYADFAILWMVAHQSRVESEKAADCWLEKWSKLSHEQGTRILSALRDGVTKSIEILGRGFVGHPRNDVLRDRLRKGELSTQDFYRQLLRTVYRLLFLFLAEDRGLLHPPSASPEACGLYDRFYSTRRLRELSERMRGSKHGDLWYSLALVFDKLNRPNGCPELGLPAFGSFLWSPAAVPDLPGPAPKNAEPVANPVLIANEDLLSAVRAIAFTEDNRVLRAVDYGSKGSEELGSVYESLLELHPEVIAGNTADSSSFDLRTAARNERKTSGSYYTPDPLVQCLLDSALEPVVADTLERARKAPDGSLLKDEALRTAQEKAILSLKVCDPACGSAHFLIAAAHRLGAHLARVRGGEVEPSPADYQHAVRDVISHCIYGVDINPMAVELCKVALWMEALEPGKPLSFLDHRIQCGNSLLGVTPALLAKGIPDEAFEPIEGDDKIVCKELKKRNKDERKGQGFLFDAAGRPWERLGNLATAMVALDSVADDTFAGVQDKQRRWQELVQSSGYLSGRLLADAWCAAFVWKKTREVGDAITESIFRRIERNPHDLTPWMRDEIKRLAEQYQFFHWHLAFPDVFRAAGLDETADNEQTGWSGGFDVAIGNPPWEMIQAQEHDFFGHVPDVASQRTRASRQRSIEQLRQSDPSLHSSYEQYVRSIAAQRHFLDHSEKYRLSIIGRINSYKVFLELGWALVNMGGRVGKIVPSGIASDDFSADFFSEIMQTHSLVSLYDFENREDFFPAVDNRMRFSLLVLRNRKHPATTAPRFAFFLQNVSELHDSDRMFSLTHEDLSLLNPNTSNCAIFRTHRDAELCKHVYRRLPVFVRESAEEVRRAWDVQFGRIFNLGHEGDAFTPVENLSNIGSSQGVMLPLYEGKMFSAYNHRAGSVEYVPTNHTRPFQGKDSTASELLNPEYQVESQFYLDEQALSDRLTPQWSQRWLLCAKDVTAATNERTLIASILPFVPTSYSVRTILGERLPGRGACCLLAMLNSVSLDWITRQFLGGLHLQDSITKQLPVLRPGQFAASCPWSRDIELGAWIDRRVLELSYTAWDVLPFARDCAYAGSPFRWDEERRFLLRCELDAAFFHLYLGTPQEWRKTGSPELLRYFPTPRDAVEFLMETFPIVKRKDEAKYGLYRTKETILSIYDEMAEVIAANEAAVAAGRQPTVAYQTRLNPPPGPPADAAGNFLPLPKWTPGQPRPANWPRHIHAPRDVHEWAIANGIDWRKLLEERRKVPLTLARAIECMVALVDAWNAPSVTRPDFDRSLLLMLNDGVRSALVNRTLSQQSRASPRIDTPLPGLDGVWGVLRGAGAVALTDAGTAQVVGRGPQYPKNISISQDDRERAREAVQAVTLIKQQQRHWPLEAEDVEFALS